MRRLLVLALLLCALPVGAQVNYWGGGAGGGAILYNAEVDVTSAGTIEELAQSLSISFPSVGHTVEILFWALHAANTNNAILQGRAGQNANFLLNTGTGGVPGTTSGGTHVLHFWITRVSSSQILIVRPQVYSPAGGAGGAVLIGSLNFANPVTVTASLNTGTAAGDLTLKYIRAQVR